MGFMESMYRTYYIYMLYLVHRENIVWGHSHGGHYFFPLNSEGTVPKILVWGTLFFPLMGA